jgi:hypothetical protein
MTTATVIEPHEFSEVIVKLRRRYLNQKQRAAWGITDLYLGTPRSAELNDERREPVLVFQVSQAMTATDTGGDARWRQIPASVAVFVYRGGKRRQVRLSTDVELVDEIIPSGRWLTASPGSDTAVRVTCGCVLQWQSRGDFGVQTETGLLTVGHAWGERSIRAEPLPVSLTARFGPPISGQLLVSTSKRGIDAALVTVDPLDLVADGIDLQRRQNWLPLAKLIAEYQRDGISLDVTHGGVKIISESPPQPRWLGVLGLQQQIIQVRSDVSDAFQPGSSGAVWLLREGERSHAIAAMQLATRSRDFSVGYGQIFDRGLLDWVDQVLQQRKSPSTVMVGSVNLLRAF